MAQVQAHDLVIADIRQATWFFVPRFLKLFSGGTEGTCLIKLPRGVNEFVLVMCSAWPTMPRNYLPLSVFISSLLLKALVDQHRLQPGATRNVNIHPKLWEVSTSLSSTTQRVGAGEVCTLPVPGTPVLPASAPILTSTRVGPRGPSVLLFLFPRAFHTARCLF